MALPGAEQRLELTQADLLDYGSLVEAFMGCDGVFHTSSPSDVISNYSVSRPRHHYFVNCSIKLQDFFERVLFSRISATGMKNSRVSVP